MGSKDETTERRFTPIIGLFLGILAVSTASLFIRFAQVEVPSIVIAAGRLTIATLVLAPFALKKGADESVSSMQTGQQATEKSVSGSLKTSESLHMISTQIEALSNMNLQVATASEEQAAVTEDINRNVLSIADLAKLTSEDIQRCAQNCNELRQLAKELEMDMSKFRL